MESEYLEKVEFWHKHILGAEAHPISINAYCRENGLKTPTYYTWRKLIKLGKSRSEKVVRPKKVKNLRSPFLPVAVVEPQTNFIKHSISPLPEARWVAEVMIHLIRGLS